MSVCYFIDGQTAGPIGTKHGIRIHLESGIALGKSRSRLKNRRRENGGASTEMGRMP